MEPVSGLTRDILDRARRSRDARFDGRFFIAVKTTRIYCRPICPSRFSHDSNVRYYATAAEAAAAGYRPCLRCRPEAAPGSPAWSGTSAVVQRALRLIQDGALDHGTLRDLANRLGVGVRHLTRLFVRHVGVAPATVAQTHRLHFAKRLLDETHLPITSIALAAGFGSIRRFNDAFRATYRRSPRQLRKTHRIAVGGGITLRLAYRPPYDWDHLLAFLASHAIPGVEVVRDGSYARAVRTPGGQAVLQVRQVPSAHALELRIQGAAPSELPVLISSARRMFDLAADPERIATSLRTDSCMGPLIARRPGLRIPGVWDPFECSVRAVLGQQSSVAATNTLLARLTECCGSPINSPTPGITHLFPAPDAVAAGRLELRGLSGNRSDALRQLARGVNRKAIRFDACTEDLVRNLCALPGVGSWAAGYVELRALGEPDAFPFGDLRLRRQLSGDGKLLTPLELEGRAERWRPFRGYAVFHVWAAAADALTI